MDNLVPRQRMGGDKEPTKGNYTYLNHTLLSAEPPPPSSSVLVRRRTCVCPPRSFVRDLACNRARVCVCVFFFLHRCAYAVGVVRQYSHQAEQSGSIN